MYRTTRWIAFMIALITIFLGSAGFVQAAPSAAECLENPQLEGCPSSNSAEDSEAPSGGNPSQLEEAEGSLLWNIIKLVLVLLLVLALIYGLLKFFNSRNKVFNQNRTMENLGGMNLAPNRSIQAVRIGEQVFILGVGDSVEIITEISDPSTKSALIQRDKHHGMEKTFPFDKWLGKWRKDEGKERSTSTTQFQQLFEKQLKDMKEKRKNASKQDQEGRDHE
ncbi:flagellar biosynthetic protein FliO [Halobacillus halophilus]|uniref:flagellar biosynthetic protein FliO n=1 Tax=Halobacillus halophilus TaxID=1570 RepID=UPI001CD428BE|nr:flagellar biosynthetic protein FliO [Halobacillus halophilus]MCA1009246.1 flagellar biosynthetic protein FliO [Halobacillus halophilus]